MPSPKGATPFSAMFSSLWGSFSSAICLPPPPTSRGCGRHKGAVLGLLSHVPSLLSGERYIGMWKADQRHGPGVMITQAGIYQGTFHEDKMAVSSSPCLGHSVGELKPSWVGNKRCPALPPSTLALARSRPLLASLLPLLQLKSVMLIEHMRASKSQVCQGTASGIHGPLTGPG